ncbi:MAG: hypothetical protein LQ351_001692 [Letrouitia transgressa]|nr:MAG: hypothetical protein LQ351_001692 [Letrouitia transgressa]
MNAESKTVKTRFCLISDTHTQDLFPAEDTKHAFREPLPSADVLLHAGDITKVGYVAEYERMFELLKKADAEVKIVIAGNHDITLDPEYYHTIGKNWMHRRIAEDTDLVKEIWTGSEARAAGITYLEEGVKSFELSNGAKFTIYASPYQPEFCNWAFPYERDEDRFNPDSALSVNPIPEWPKIDIMLTHGPPYGILDETWRTGEKVGCEHLLRAVRRCRPQLHCFGHIHEGWGAQRVHWDNEQASERLETNQTEILKNGSAHVDISGNSSRPLKFGEETLFVNAAIMNVKYRPENAPWTIDLELPKVVAK